MARLIFCLLILTACGAAPLPAPGDPPFTAAQIRAATSAGRTYRFRITSAGQAPRIQVIEFTAVDATGATMRQQALDPQGKPTADATEAQVKWTDLEAHGRSPAGQTTVTAARVKVPAGEFDAVRVVIERDGETVRSWFARDLPGAPVKQTVHRGDTRVLLMELVEHMPGRAEASPDT